MSEQNKTPTSMIGGIMITAGTAVGAGMFSLPTVASGMWFGWSLVCMALSWFCMYKCCLLILEVNIHYPRGASFDTMVKGTLGRFSNIINGFLFAFVLYILDYAYISGGGSIVNHTLNALFGVAPPQMISGVLFAVVFSTIIWISTRAVDRVVTVLVIGMLISFGLTAADLSLTAEIGRLFMTAGADNEPFVVFTFAALPYFLTAFGFYSIVPSLYRYYGKQPQLIGRSIFIGSLFPMLIYLVWMMSTMGNLPREAFATVVEQGGNIGVLLGAMNQGEGSERLSGLLTVFANMAVVSSFLGVSLSLFDFIADRFKFPDTHIGRLKTALVAFVPPSIGGLFFPNGFLYAIGFAGLASAINALIFPPLMLKKAREKFPDSDVSIGGSMRLSYFLLAMGVIYAVCHVLAMLGWLPVYGK
ncbi:aromatic amino acid transport family protein [Porticoccus sp. GXU_MW_L64]